MYYKYLADSDAQYEMAEIVFATHDHSIMDAHAMQLKQISVAQLIQVSHGGLYVHVVRVLVCARVLATHDHNQRFLFFCLLVSSVLIHTANTAR